MVRNRSLGIGEIFYMNRMYIFFFMVFGFCACGRGKYYSKNAWLIPAEFDYYRLKDSPRRVTEYTYEGKTDSGVNQMGQYYQVYDFDREGDITDRRLFVKGKLVMVLQTSFGVEGYLMKMVDSRSGFRDTLFTGSRAVGGGWFKSYTYGETGNTKTFLTRFWKDGEEQLNKIYDDSAATGNPVQRVYVYYQGQRMLKQIVSNGSALLEQRYFYGAGGGPDSVEWLTGGRVAQRELFRNNQWGDPLSYLKVAGKDTGEYRVFGYRYDEKGNWVWRRDSSRAKVTITERAFDY
jgi:hypothetical protein